MPLKKKHSSRNISKNKIKLCDHRKLDFKSEKWLISLNYQKICQHVFKFLYFLLSY